jgi:putative membrane protein
MTATIATTLGEVLPTVNAGLNSLSAGLLLAGLFAIRHRLVDLHRKCMMTAFGVSMVFLVSYLVRVALTGTHRFPGSGAAKAVYLSILFSHMALAAVTPVLAIRALYLGWQRRFPEHKRLVRYAWPIWMYVSVTGVVVYLMLYHWPVSH